ncbi:hypothetical protein SBRY_30896 [Actinacidiphila bryophytorum]|uniref:Uncharacterized protein n=1 Tax=Actinacidiphila bryophytorum TaxID=1436133 RepID=A0A9W4H1W9_9ACTN|nr:hypothetical protein SBRY_30896 [Actinacidiphila bryophytorum]
MARGAARRLRRGDRPLGGRGVGLVRGRPAPLLPGQDDDGPLRHRLRRGVGTPAHRRRQRRRGRPDPAAGAGPPGAVPAAGRRTPAGVRGLVRPGDPRAPRPRRRRAPHPGRRPDPRRRRERRRRPGGAGRARRRPHPGRGDRRAARPARRHGAATARPAPAVEPRAGAGHARTAPGRAAGLRPRGLSLARRTAVTAPAASPQSWS